MGTSSQAAAAASRPMVVVNVDNVTRTDASRRITRLIPAGVISAIVHVGLIGLFFLVNVQSVDSNEPKETGVFDTEVGDEKPPPNLENDEIGLDPDVQTNYNVSRIEEVSVPGPVNANEAVGIQNAPEGPPMTLPPPPGIGGIGTGAGLDDPNRVGTGNLVGIAGGMGGPRMIAGGFGGRSGSTRQQMVTEGGGNTASEAAVASGLKWLAEHQAPDGRWSLHEFSRYGNCNCTNTGKATQNDVAGTAFGLLPLLGAGQTHKTGADKGNIYTKNVDRALKYLLLSQNRDGAFHTNMYAQGLATIAVCEAYALTSDPVLRGPAQRSINYICDAQSDEGGWRYGRRQAGFDTSVGGWQVMALKSGQMAGLAVPKKTLLASNKWLDAAASTDGGGYGYTGPGETPTLSAVGLLCRQYLGWGPRSPGLVAGVARLQKAGPIKNNMYYNYYATQVMHHMGDEAWKTWNVKMRDSLIESQDKGADGKHPHQRGSWYTVGDGISGGHGGRIMCTSLSLLTLEVYYRHLPLYRREVGGDKALAEK